MTLVESCTHEADSCPVMQCRADGEQNSPANSAGGRGATFSTTAQRYAAYRLRAAQGECQDSWGIDCML